MNCYYCGEPISAFRAQLDGDFCCNEHRQKYQRVARSSLARLAEADEIRVLAEGRSHPLELGLAALAGRFRGRCCDSVPLPYPRAALEPPPDDQPVRLKTVRIAFPGHTGVRSPGKSRGGTPAGAGWTAYALTQAPDPSLAIWALRTAGFDVPPPDKEEFLAVSAEASGRGHAEFVNIPPGFRGRRPLAGSLAFPPLEPHASFLRAGRASDSRSRPRAEARECLLGLTGRAIPEEAGLPDGEDRRSWSARLSRNRFTPRPVTLKLFNTKSFRLPPVLPKPLPGPVIRQAVMR